MYFCVIICMHWALQVLQVEGVAPAVNNSDEINCQTTAAAPELNSSTTGNGENWMVLSIAGNKPTPRLNVNNYWFPVLCVVYVMHHLISTCKILIQKLHFYFFLG